MGRIVLWFRIKYGSWRSRGAWTCRCWFCGGYGSNVCAVCDRELCEQCAQFHGEIGSLVIESRYLCQAPFDTRYQLST
jgi:hypothetical protein